MAASRGRCAHINPCLFEGQKKIPFQNVSGFPALKVFKRKNPLKIPESSDIVKKGPKMPESCDFPKKMSKIPESSDFPKRG